MADARAFEPAEDNGRIYSSRSNISALFLAGKGVWMMTKNPADDSTSTIVPGEMITFEVPSGKQAYEEMIRIIDGRLERTKLTERQVKDVRQAVIEMGGNAMEWGHGWNPALKIRIDFWADSEAVTFRVRDQGARFEHFHNCRAMPSIDELMKQGLTGLPRGFGIMLARGLMDEFFYNDRGNEVTLIKRVGKVGESGAD